MANATANLNRRFMCSGRLRSGVALNAQAPDVIGCNALLSSTNPLQWTVAFHVPLPIASQFDLLEIHGWCDFGDGSAAAFSSQIRPSNITATGFVLNFFDKNGAAVASNLVGCWFEVWVRDPI